MLRSKSLIELLIVFTIAALHIIIMVKIVEKMNYDVHKILTKPIPGFKEKITTA